MTGMGTPCSNYMLCDVRKFSNESTTRAIILGGPRGPTVLVPRPILTNWRPSIVENKPQLATHLRCLSMAVSGNGSLELRQTRDINCTSGAAGNGCGSENRKHGCAVQVIGLAGTGGRKLDASYGVVAKSVRWYRAGMMSQALHVSNFDAGIYADEIGYKRDMDADLVCELAKHRG